MSKWFRVDKINIFNKIKINFALICNKKHQYININKINKIRYLNESHWQLKKIRLIILTCIVKIKQKQLIIYAQENIICIF